jgi:hypothetical protein
MKVTRNSLTQSGKVWRRYDHCNVALALQEQRKRPRPRVFNGRAAVEPRLRKPRNNKERATIQELKHTETILFWRSST